MKLTDDQLKTLETEITFTAVASGGPGGQHVNKTATKIRLDWNVTKSRVFSDDEKTAITQRVPQAHLQLLATDIAWRLDKFYPNQANLPLCHGHSLKNAREETVPPTVWIKVVYENHPFRPTAQVRGLRPWKMYSWSHWYHREKYEIARLCPDREYSQPLLSNSRHC